MLSGMNDADWEAFVARTRQMLAAVAAKRATITYDALRQRLGNADGVTLDPTGEHDVAALLRAVSVAADDAGEGLLSAVVVRRSGLPGGGWFRLAHERGRDVSDRQRAWRTEIERVWSTFAPGDARQ